MSNNKQLFVTVGTTNFDKLISTVLQDDFLTTLKCLGFKKLILQFGTGKVPKKDFPDIEIVFEQYIEDFQQEIIKADLIISHAGAGTCLEVFRHGKPAVVVINEDLMDNHQLELARQLDKDGFIYYCTCKELNECVKKDFGGLKKYCKSDGLSFARYLDKCVGFE
ncbi:UDP-N-acetylglucosamine transferase subunit ALG13 [Onthophagus taurus]|uniref:UDP-N-acetylglucosamine transferase subunit ALG13 n=1 Tax=Onthophagus taurus TaxID=166361 RepID=UPI0039BE2609